MAVDISYDFPQYQSSAATPETKAGTLKYERMSDTWWVYVQAADAITEATVLMPVGNGVLLNLDVDAIAAIGARRITGTGDFTVANLAGSTAIGVSMGHTLRIYFDAGTGSGQGGVLYSRFSDDAADVYIESGGTTFADGGVLITALAATTDYVVFCKTRVTPTTAATDKVIGSCQRNGGITDERWFWALHKGSGWVVFDQSDGAVATDDIGLIPSATTAGWTSGLTATATTAQIAAMFARTPITNDADGLLFAEHHCDTIWNTGVPPAPSRKTLAYPAWWRTTSG